MPHADDDRISINDNNNIYAYESSQARSETKENSRGYMAGSAEKVQKLISNSSSRVVGCEHIQRVGFVLLSGCKSSGESAVDSCS